MRRLSGVELKEMSEFGGDDVDSDTIPNKRHENYGILIG